MRDDGDKDPDLLRNLRQDIFPELPPLNDTLGPEELKTKLASLVEKRKEIESIKRRLLKAKDVSGLDSVRDKSTIEDEED